MALKVLYRSPDELMANAVRDLLEQNGIPALIRSFQIPAYDGIARMMRPDWGQVLVEDADLDRATELLDGFLATDGSSGSDEPPAGDDAT